MKIENYIEHRQKITAGLRTETPHAGDIAYMKKCLTLARSAGAAGEIPVGALLVRGEEILAESGNTRERDGTVTGHAELRVIEAANRKSGSWRLEGCTLYVTLEPCPMCAGAIADARIERVVFGAADRRCGAFGSVLDLRAYPLAHTPRLTGGVLEEECRALLSDFFERMRGQIGEKKGQ